MAVLTQILVQAIKQLYELQRIVQSGQDTLNLMRDINRGINDSLKLVESLGPYIDPGLYKELKKVQDLVKHLNGSYGTVVDSPDRVPQEDTDRVVAEAISVNNALYDYAKELDKVGERIKIFSHEVSPGGAQKLTAQSLGVMVHVMNQQLRATATGLKIQAQALAVQNKKEKQGTEAFMSQAASLRTRMKKQEVKFEFPRF
ncbi:hypothetical protein [Bdellovibrio sp.]|uniref:hypothetical protein n=1 Tax=Bdellovibrio sp. TaxID=28201 RepID=UPI0032216B05